jgi:AcrR family transcriptional regulator
MSEASQSEDKARRRRGAALEAAILEAAWEELTEVGYPAFTMEAVAARAKTSKPVLYRRWQNRAELVVAAARHHADASTFETPDTGNLRSDVLALLRLVSRQINDLAGFVALLFADYGRETGLPPAALRQRMLAGGRSRMETVMRRAVERGEIDAKYLDTRIAQLPMDLVRNDMIMTQAPLTEAAIREIVDVVFLPLLHYGR